MLQKRSNRENLNTGLQYSTTGNKIAPSEEISSPRSLGEAANFKSIFAFEFSL
jgi:hypothetical protein